MIYMKQSEFKKRYDVKMGRYVKKHIYGEGVTDVFKTIDRKLFGKTVEEAAKTATKTTINRGLLAKSFEKFQNHPYG